MAKLTSRQRFIAAVAEAAQQAMKKRGARGLNIAPGTLVDRLERNEPALGAEKSQSRQ